MSEDQTTQNQIKYIEYSSKAEEDIKSMIYFCENFKLNNPYSIISNKNHSITLTFQNLNSSIRIFGSYEDDIIKNNYEKKLTIDELKQNKYLGLCESIDEIYLELITLLK